MHGSRLASELCAPYSWLVCKQPTTSPREAADCYGVGKTLFFNAGRRLIKIGLTYIKGNGIGAIHLSGRFSDF